MKISRGSEKSMFYALNSLREIAFWLFYFIKLYLDLDIGMKRTMTTLGVAFVLHFLMYVLSL